MHIVHMYMWSLHRVRWVVALIGDAMQAKTWNWANWTSGYGPANTVAYWTRPYLSSLIVVILRAININCQIVKGSNSLTYVTTIWTMLQFSDDL